MASPPTRCTSSSRPSATTRSRGRRSALRVRTRRSATRATSPLLACSDEQLQTYRGMGIGPTFVHHNMRFGHPLIDEVGYPSYNKPASVMFWLDQVDVKEEFIALLDTDMQLREPLDPVALGARRGVVVAAEYAYLVGTKGKFVRRFLEAEEEPLAAQCGGFHIFHREDLRVIAPLWIEYTRRARVRARRPGAVPPRVVPRLGGGVGDARRRRARRPPQAGDVAGRDVRLRLRRRRRRRLARRPPRHDALPGLRAARRHPPRNFALRLRLCRRARPRRRRRAPLLQQDDARRPRPLRVRRRRPRRRPRRRHLARRLLVPQAAAAAATPAAALAARPAVHLDGAGAQRRLLRLLPRALRRRRRRARVPGAPPRARRAAPPLRRHERRVRQVCAAGRVRLQPGVDARRVRALVRRVRRARPPPRRRGPRPRPRVRPARPPPRPARRDGWHAHHGRRATAKRRLRELAAEHGCAQRCSFFGVRLRTARRCRSFRTRASAPTPRRRRRPAAALPHRLSGVVGLAGLAPRSAASGSRGRSASAAAAATRAATRGCEEGSCSSSAAAARSRGRRGARRRRARWRRSCTTAARPTRWSPSR